MGGVAMNVRNFINGKLVQVDRNCNLEKTMTPNKSSQCASMELTPEKVAEAAKTGDASQASDYERKVSLESLVSSKRFVAISLPNCPQCDELAAALASRGVPVSSVFVKWEKSSTEYPALKAALAVHAGDQFTFPQV